jgi:hypothetical protein
MQFVANGPDVPDALLESHEEGRVVFFCGAGISYPAGLPGFSGLVDDIYRLVGTRPDALEQAACKRGQFDAALELLERRLPGHRQAVREALFKTLQPRLRRKGATGTHKALLQLGRDREGALRLVTTNFDRIFARLTVRMKPTVSAYPAPLLPIPKKSRWNGLVYLHGLLPERPDSSALNRLVLTSGDFGLAYLTERWAARFVSELFRHYIVCFVGYGINDPVLRYMMDALAADRRLGEATPQAYALADFALGQEREKTIEWEAKGVVPILYEIPSGTPDHSTLHRTLKAWADTHRDGIFGKERIVVDYAVARPSASTKQDDFVGRMLWALSHKSGLPAKRFANFDPVPSLDWLEAFSVDRYRQGDLMRFGVPSLGEVDEKLHFSLARRPTSYILAPWMTFVSDSATNSEWDDVMLHLAHWLMRHLDDPALILWLAQRGDRLHPRLLSLIENTIDAVVQLEQKGNVEELARIRAGAANAIPRPQLRTLWRLFPTGRVKSRRGGLDLHRWKARFKRDGLTTTLRFQLRSLLAPCVALRPPFSRRETNSESQSPERLKELVAWELVLGADEVHSALADLARVAPWRDALPELFNDFQQLLRDALDLMRELGEAAERGDGSHWDQPSISRHRQNRGFRDWVALIELLRDSWLAIRELDSTRAARLAQDWFNLPYSTFKRLGLFAASQDNCVAADRWVTWLLEDGTWWLWSIDTRRETLRLFVLQGSHLTLQVRSRLEAAILAGPPREMYSDGIEPERWQAIVNRSVWLYLAKLKSSGTDLGPAAEQRLDAISTAEPKWRLANNERDEFSHWISGSGDQDFEDSRDIEPTPRTRRELLVWLKRPRPSQRPFYEDTWRETCRDRFFHSALALCDLAEEGQWPPGHWREALQVWSEEGRTLRSWRFIAPRVLAMPPEVLTAIADSITWWLEAVSKVLDRYEDSFLKLCQRILLQPYPEVIDANQPVTAAINHPVGHVTQGLLNVWFRREPNDNDGLPIDLAPFFTMLCDTSVTHFRHGRVLLASRLIALFRVDRPWTERNLLPLFDWEIDPGEARAVWEGFLWSPRLYPPLMSAFKNQLLATVSHYAELGEQAQQFAGFLTYAALETAEPYTTDDFRTAFSVLPQSGLESSTQALIHALEGSGEQREDYWANRIQPFWQTIWPKSGQLASHSISENLARLTIAARGRFPNALNALQGWLHPIEHTYFVVHLLRESGLSTRFPEPALRLLDALIHDQPWGAPELSECLAAISNAEPALLEDPRHKRLTEYSRRHDG